MKMKGEGQRSPPEEKIQNQIIKPMIHHNDFGHLDNDSPWGFLEVHLHLKTMLALNNKVCFAFGGAGVAHRRHQVPKK